MSSVEPQKDSTVEPEKKKVIISQKPTGGWEIKFKGNLTRGDMNQLHRFLLVEFSRYQRHKAMQHIATTSIPEYVKQKEV